MVAVNPYDELAYLSAPIEWTAPERLSMASRLHGGPRPAGKGYRVLELGCANGANLIPLAYYRQHGHFVGLDGASTQIEIARSRVAHLGLQNIEFQQADFLRADDVLAGDFDYIIAHGIFSWVDESTRHALLELCARRLSPDGLLYLNYNCRPGWNVRGMVRDFLLAQTATIIGLEARAHCAQQVAAKIVNSLPRQEHPYSALMNDEFQFVCESDVSYVAHEYLADHNHAFWRSEFMALAGRYGLAYVVDADFNYGSARIPAELPNQLQSAAVIGKSLDDTIDLLCYRQLHSPILSRSSQGRRPMEAEEFFALFIASPLARQNTDGGIATFLHPNGFEVEAKDEAMRSALEKLQSVWPRGICAKDLFATSNSVMDDLLLLHRNGLIDLRLDEPAASGIDPQRLHELEGKAARYATNAYHVREAARCDADIECSAA